VFLFYCWLIAWWTRSPRKSSLCQGRSLRSRTFSTAPVFFRDVSHVTGECREPGSFRAVRALKPSKSSDSVKFYKPFTDLSPGIQRP
jgi:hypothetical protein